jgi:nucleoside 2-deoxyribosyltransferase
MSTIYLCGGINGLSDAQCKDWREHVKQQLSDQYQFLDPMRRDFRGKEDGAVAEIVEGDYDDLENSDIVLVNACKPSWGTAMEMHYAFLNLNKTVVAVCDAERPSPWLRYHCHFLFKTFDEAIHLRKLIDLTR